jgi:hypothetical protein
MPPDYWQRPCAPWIATANIPARKRHRIQAFPALREPRPFPRVLSRAAPQKKLKQQHLGGEAPTGPGEGHPGPPPNSPVKMQKL